VSSEVSVSGVDPEAAGDSGRSAFLGVVLGTVVMGISGFVVLVVAAAGFGAEDYALFGVFWAALYFVVAVVTGAQHESTRASLAPPGTRSSSLVVFACSLALALFVVVAGSSIWWSDAAFGSGHRQLGLLAGLGCAGYALTCVLGGSLAGAGRWTAFAALLVVEGIVRAVAVCLAMLTTPHVELVAWVVVATYPVTLLLVLVPVVRRGAPAARVSSSFRQLWANTSQTMAASAGVGALITGFPFAMSTLARDEPRATVGAMTLALMLTRAPLLVPLTGMQSFLVSTFVRSDRNRAWHLLTRLLLVVAVVALVLAGIASLIGAPVLTTIFGDDFSVQPAVLATLVGSSGCVAAMAVAAPALIARRLLAANAIAWIIASVLAVAVLAVAPWGLGWRTAVSLSVGPSVGLVIQLIALRRASDPSSR
jgi:O-antigen/teichoic acid export membrane protein